MADGKKREHLYTMVYCTSGRKQNGLTIPVLRTYTYILWHVRLCYRSAFAFWHFINQQ